MSNVLSIKHQPCFSNSCKSLLFVLTLLEISGKIVFFILTLCVYSLSIYFTLLLYHLSIMADNIYLFLRKEKQFGRFPLQYLWQMYETLSFQMQGMLITQMFLHVPIKLYALLLIGLALGLSWKTDMYIYMFGQKLNLNTTLYQPHLSTLTKQTNQFQLNLSVLTINTEKCNLT